MFVIRGMQETFDKVVNHLFAQGGPAVNENGHCVYRASDGKQCAFGCLIPDEYYNPNMENQFCNDLEDISFENKNIESLCIKLQSIHDEYAFGSKEKSWQDYLTRKFTYIAKKYNLTFIEQS